MMKSNKKNKYIAEMAMENAFNAKYYSELSDFQKTLILKMFPSIKIDDLIICQKNKSYMKPNLYFEVQGIKKYVLMKNGSQKVIHQEDINTLLQWMIDNGISEETITTLRVYLNGELALDENSKKIMPKEIGLRLKNKIKLANIELNNRKDFILSFIYRALIKGEFQNGIEIDYLYYGNKNYGVIVNKNQIYDYIKKKNWDYVNNLHIGPIQLKPHIKNKNKETKSTEYKKIIDCHWTNLDNDLRYINQNFYKDYF